MIGQLIYFVMYVIALGLVVWLLMFLLDYVPVPEPFNRVAKVVLMCAAVIALCFLIADLVGVGPNIRSIR